jgi:hypothetical protein
MHQGVGLLTWRLAYHRVSVLREAGKTVWPSMMCSLWSHNVTSTRPYLWKDILPDLEAGRDTDPISGWKEFLTVTSQNRSLYLS